MTSFTLLYERYLESIYRYVAARLATREEAEDVTSEVFERALRHRHIPARGARHGHRVHESFRGGAHLPQPLGASDRRDHLHQRETFRLDGAAQLIALVERQVRYDEPRDIRARGRCR
jgi:hypothetical protein